MGGWRRLEGVARGWVWLEGVARGWVWLEGVARGVEEAGQGVTSGVGGAGGRGTGCGGG